MSWTTYQFPLRNLPTCAGVYVVFFDGIAVYVGQSRNVANRFYDHSLRYGYAKNIHTPWCDLPSTTRVTVKVKRSRRYGDWAMDELRLIARIQPIYNSQHKARKRA